MSLAASADTNVAGRAVPSPTVTVMLVAPSTTCALVTTYPRSASMTTPVPAPSPLPWNGPRLYSTIVSMETTDASTESSTAATSMVVASNDTVAICTASLAVADTVGEDSPSRPPANPAPAATPAIMTQPAAVASGR